jgi:hypothetical protein
MADPPEKEASLFTNERMRELSAMALELAVTAPEIRRVGSNYGYVPWSLIERARAACDAVGIDWRVLRSQAIVQASMSAMMDEGAEPS